LLTTPIDGFWQGAGKWHAASIGRKPAMSWQVAPGQQVTANRRRRLEHGIAVAFREGIRTFLPGDRLENFKESNSEEAAEE
jgi:hypothetical protein